MRQNPQQHGNVQLPCVNYSWMSPCSSNFCFLLCILGTAAGLVSTLSQLPGAWATIGLCVLNNYPLKKKKKQNPQNRLLTTTHSAEVAQMLVSTTSELGLDREAWDECLG